MVNETQTGTPEVVALIDDLFFQAKVMETARRIGVSLKTVSTGAVLLEMVNPANGATAGRALPRLVLVDLNARHGVLDAIEQLQKTGNAVPVIGFLSHVQTDLAERARAAGCKQVMPRSVFTANLAQILAQAKA